MVRIRMDGVEGDCWLVCVNNPRAQVLATAGVQALSRSEAEAVMAEFYGKPR